MDIPSRAEKKKTLNPKLVKQSVIPLGSNITPKKIPCTQCTPSFTENQAIKNKSLFLHFYVIRLMLSEPDLVLKMKVFDHQISKIFCVFMRKSFGASSQGFLIIRVQEDPGQLHLLK